MASARTSRSALHAKKTSHDEASDNLYGAVTRMKPSSQFEIGRRISAMSGSSPREKARAFPETGDGQAAPVEWALKFQN